MRIVCPNCDTSYAVPAEKIGKAGRQVRCARCGINWHATAVSDPAPAADRAEAAPRRADPPPVAAPVAVEPPAPRPVPPTVAAPAAVEPPPPAPRPEPDAADRMPAPADELPERDRAEAAAAIDDFAAAMRAGPAAAEGDASRPEAASVPAKPAEAAAPVPRTLVAEPAKPKPVDVESVAKRPSIKVRARSRPQIRLPRLDVRAAWARSKPYVGIGLFALALAAPILAVLLRSTIADAVPSLAGLYRTLGMPINLRGLVFDKVETLQELDGGQQVLVVEGVIVNVTDERRPIPSVRLALRADDSQEIYAWSIDPRSTSVAAGGSVRFRTKLAAPPTEARDVQIRFTERRVRQAVAP